MRYQYWLACMVDVIGVHKIHQLLKLGGTAEAVYRMGERELSEKAGLSEAAAEKLLQTRQKMDLDLACEQLERKNIHLITIEETAYPKRLRRLVDAPYGLFVRGRLPEEDRPSAAIVGARLCTEYGRECAGRLGEVLGAQGIEIISGMAKGIDSAGHYGALRGGGGTYAVLGCGSDICYPAGNWQLYEKLIGTGGVISEYPPGTLPLARHFPVRNRIISGLGDILIVVEAKERSGSLITADAALEQGKEVYAVPGRLGDVLSLGCNRLIKQGAGLILSPEDFLKDLGVLCDREEIKKKFSKNLLEKEEVLLYSVLDLREKNINEIVSETGFEISECIRLLAGLEEKGLVRETFQNYYIRTLNG